ncbi:MAG: YbaB/EbfC family nucleoid-associated protein [Christensenellales bacterium]
MAKNFGGFGGGNMQAMMRQAQKMQQDMKKAQEELQESEITASSGGGVVEVTINGSKELLSIKIKPEAMDRDDPEMLEDLITAAFNDAYHQLEELSEKIMGPYASMLGGLL